MKLNDSPPWNLRGKAYILIYKISKKKIESQIKDLEFKGGWGAIMMIRYFESNVGNYDEILWTPGKFSYNHIVAHSIQKIYVSSYDSLYGGRKNWGIPKEIAHFYFENQDHIETIKIGSEKEIFFSCRIHLSNRWGINFKNQFILPNKLLQIQNHKLFLTKFKYSGKAYYAKVLEIESNPQFFPFPGKPLISFYVNPFFLYFPEAQIFNL